jgi:hypothetical protein
MTAANKTDPARNGFSGRLLLTTRAGSGTLGRWNILF